MRGLKLTKFVVPLVGISIFATAFAAWVYWSVDGAPVSTAPGGKRECAATPDGEGGVIVAWTDTRNSNESSGWDIYAQRLSSTGDALWELDGLDVCAASETQQGPVAVSDGAGGAIITWFDERAGETNIYAQRVDASGDTLWPLNGICVSDSGCYYAEHATVSDGTGGAIVVWERPYSETGTRGINGHRVNASGNLMWAPGGADLLSFEVTGGYLYISELSIIPAGADSFIIAAFLEDESGNRILAQKVDVSGTALWGPSGISVVGGSYYGAWSIVSDGTGGAIIIWDESAGEYQDVYAQRVSASGDLLWYPTGVPVCTAVGDQYYPVSTTDGAGGAIVAWVDRRVWGDSDVYAQRLDPSGNCLWTSDGVNLCTTAGEQGEIYGLSVVPAGTNGAIVFFENYLPYTRSDICAQMVDSGGSLLWTSDGLPVITADGNQQEPVAVSDGSDGGIVVWRDRLPAPDTHLYAQHVVEPTDAVKPRDPSAHGGTLAQNVPNPFSSSTRIDFQTDVGGDVRLEIYDVSGRLVRIIHDGPVLPQGQSKSWDGRDEHGRPLPSGVYFCKAVGEGWSSVKKMTLAR
jgi:hypothetical protein